MKKQKFRYAIVRPPCKRFGVIFYLDGHRDTFEKHMLSKTPIKVEPSQEHPHWYVGDLDEKRYFNYHESWLKFVENK